MGNTIENNNQETLLQIEDYPLPENIRDLDSLKHNAESLKKAVEILGELLNDYDSICENFCASIARKNTNLMCDEEMAEYLDEYGPLIKYFVEQSSVNYNNDLVYVILKTDAKGVFVVKNIHTVILDEDLIRMRNGTWTLEKSLQYRLVHLLEKTEKENFQDQN